MSTNDLFSGIAVVIDDEIKKNEANINQIISQIEKHKMPCLKYGEIPEDDVIKNWKGISFILLDWNLNDLSDADTMAGVINPKYADTNITANTNFLKNLKNICFVPVFIFTNEVIDEVSSKLQEEGLYKENKPNYIFIKKKSELTGKNSLFKAIQDWIKHTPPVYVLKVWESEYEKAKTDLFHNFYEIDPNWPKIIWKSFSDDGIDINVSSGLGEMISRNLHTRMTPFKFDSAMIKRRAKNKNNSIEETRRVFTGERFLDKDKIHENTIVAGDIFKIKGDIFLNIRPDCDCIPRNGTTCDILQKVELYLIKGAKLSKKQEKDIYIKKYGYFKEGDNESIIFSMFEGKTFSFQFKNIRIEKWQAISDKRIGRLLPPYITKIQQKYSLYIQRQGMPRIPNIFKK